MDSLKIVRGLDVSKLFTNHFYNYHNGRGAEQAEFTRGYAGGGLSLDMSKSITDDTDGSG